MRNIFWKSKLDWMCKMSKCCGRYIFSYYCEQKWKWFLKEVWSWLLIQFKIFLCVIFRLTLNETRYSSLLTFYVDCVDSQALLVLDSVLNFLEVSNNLVQGIKSRFKKWCIFRISIYLASVPHTDTACWNCVSICTYWSFMETGT